MQLPFFGMQRIQAGEDFDVQRFQKMGFEDRQKITSSHVQKLPAEEKKIQPRLKSAANYGIITGVPDNNLLLGMKNQHPAGDLVPLADIPCKKSKRPTHRRTSIEMHL